MNTARIFMHIITLLTSRSMTKAASPMLLSLLLLTTLLLASVCDAQSFSASAGRKSNMAAAADEESENLSPWSNRWNDNRIGFHLKDVNPILEKYSKVYLPSSDSTTSDETCAAVSGGNTRVFVPLCGKTIDLAFLTTLASEVVGVEGIRLALEQFAEEQPSLNIKAKDAAGAPAADGFERFVGDTITLLKGDYFELDASKTGGQFGIIFDRASMVAIEPNLREAYVDVIGKLLAPGGMILLVVLERVGSEDAMQEGPPYSIPEATVRELYGKPDWVESIKLLEQSDQLEKKPEDRERYPNLDKLLETVYEIKRKA